MRRPARRPLLALLTLLLPITASPAGARGPDPDEALVRFRAARERSLARGRAMALTVESENLYTVVFTERPGLSELATRRLDPAALDALPRPPFWWPEARVHRGVHLWSAEVESLATGEPASLLDPGAFRLAATEEMEARGLPALRLVFEGIREPWSRVEVTVDRASFDPLVVEHIVLGPVEADGARLGEYHLRLSIAPVSGLWLVAQGEESYRFATRQGGRDVSVTWKSLAWEGRPARELRRVAELAAAE